MSAVKAEILKRLEELKDKAQQETDVDALVEINTFQALVETEGKTIVEKPRYRVFLEKCLLEGERPSTQEAARAKMKECAKKWTDLPEEEKEKIKRELEVRNP